MYSIQVSLRHAWHTLGESSIFKTWSNPEGEAAVDYGEMLDRPKVSKEQVTKDEQAVREELVVAGAWPRAHSCYYQVRRYETPNGRQQQQLFKKKNQVRNTTTREHRGDAPFSGASTT